MVKKIILQITCLVLLTACGQSKTTTPATYQILPTIELPTREPTETPEPLNEPVYAPDNVVTPLELTAIFNLPAGYLAEIMAMSPAADMISISRSESGSIFLQRGGLISGISILDSATGDVHNILSTVGMDVGHLFGGPGENALLRVGRELWLIKPDGTHTIWSQSMEGEPLFYDSGGDIFGVSEDRESIFRQSPGISSSEVAAGFEEITDLVVSRGGVLFLVDGAVGQVIRVDPAGNRMLLVAGAPAGSRFDLGLDTEGNLYMNNPSIGFVKVDPQSGHQEKFESIYSTCTRQPGDFVITENGVVIFLDVSSSQIVWGDLPTGQTGVLVANLGLDSGYVDIGPDGALYLGVTACGGAMPSQIVRVDLDGSRQVAFDGLSGQITAMAYDPHGGVFVATSSAASENRLWYYHGEGAQPILLDTYNESEVLSLDVDPNNGHVYATVAGSQRIFEYDWEGLVHRHYVILPREPQQYDLAIDGYGQVFAYMSEKGRYWSGPIVDRYLLKLVLEESRAELIQSFPLRSCCPTGSLYAEPDGTLWLLTNPEGQLLRIPVDDDSEVFAQGLPEDSKGLAVNLYGDVFITTSGGVVRFYRNNRQ